MTHENSKSPTYYEEGAPLARGTTNDKPETTFISMDVEDTNLTKRNKDKSGSNKYQQLQESESRDSKDDIFRFKWMKYEVPILFCTVIPWVVYLVYDFAKINRKVANEEKIVGLTEGYFGVPRDTNDTQWRAWRENLPLFLIVGALHLTLSAAVKKLTADSIDKKATLIFHLVFGAIYVGYVEQAGLLWWLFFTGGFFTVIMMAHHLKFFPLLLWFGSLVTLYLNERYAGYGFTFLSKSFANLHENFATAPVRWDIIFNMTILRMISFGMDLYWAYHQKPISQKNTKTLSYRERQETHQPLKNYNILTYYSYLLYVPLFLTGPIISFNAWISQIYVKQKEYSNIGIVKYALRFVFCFFCFEAFLHIFYVNSISTRLENSHIWQNYFQTHHILMMSLFELFFLWFKFMIIWRFARLWALIDGIESPENMNRCVANNYCFEGFWRSWHRSFNQWLIRYIFIPLGGSKYKMYNIWAVFGFVAIWHDMNLNLLLWSWIICLSLMPEMLIKFYFHQRKNRHYWDKLWFRYAAAGLCTILTLAMMIANLIGYGTGHDTLLLILKRVRDNQEIGTVVGACVILFLNDNLLFKLREWESKKGATANF